MIEGLIGLVGLLLAALLTNLTMNISRQSKAIDATIEIITKHIAVQLEINKRYDGEIIELKSKTREMHNRTNTISDKLNGILKEHEILHKEHIQ